MIANQPSLFAVDTLAPIVTPQYGRNATIQERFDEFNRQNPQVYRALRTLALQMARSGVRRYGIKGLIERLRWDFAIQTKGDGFKICNSFTSRYARLLMENEPELRGFFELRELTSE